MTCLSIMLILESRYLNSQPSTLSVNIPVDCVKDGEYS